VLYCDTDAVIYIQKLDEAPKVETRDFLGDLTDELEEFGSGSYIEEFVSGGPKNYGFTVFCPATEKRTSKCKGYKLELQQFTGCKLMIMEDNTPLHVHNPKQTKR
jgi:hypothetical protein